jgi:hypothetical protein
MNHIFFARAEPLRKARRSGRSRNFICIEENQFARKRAVDAFCALGKEKVVRFDRRMAKRRRTKPVDPQLPAAIADEIAEIVRREIAAALAAAPIEPSYTIKELAAAEGMSRATLHDILKSGRGPATIRPSPQIVRITHKARQEWHRQLEREEAERNKHAGGEQRT